MAASVCLVRRALIAAVLSLVSLSGCGGGDEVRSYKVPKASDRGEKGGPAAAAAGGEYRILGVMYPADDPVWFVKFTGPADKIARREAEFDKLAASVKLQANPEAVPTFTLPSDEWKPAGPRSIHAQTIRVDGLEVTITTSRGGAEGNAVRWAGQVGHPAAKDWKKYTREITADGGKGVRVDVTGPQNPSAGGMPPMMGGR